MSRFFSIWVSSGRRLFALLLLGLMVAGARVEAQVSLSYSILGSPNPALVNSNLTYTISLTNNGIAVNIVVTNTLDAQCTFVSATNTFPGATTTNNGNVVVFSFNSPFDPNLLPVAQMTVIAQPTAVGLVTNTVTFNIIGIPTFTTNIVTRVTNAPSILADLAVAMKGPTMAVFSNDWMSYGVSVTNLGPNTAPNVFLTNTLPPGVGYITNSPAFTRLGTGSNVVISLGSLTNGAFRNFVLTVQPTNAGALTFSSVVNSTTMTDPTPANNTASFTVAVSNFLSGQLVAYTNSAQVPNGQVGYLEQTIVVSNKGPTTVAAVRVMVSGLTNRLANAVGTNNGNPFVVYSSSLDPGQSVNLLLQFYPNRTAFAFGNSQLHAVEVTPLNLAPPANLSSKVNFTGIFRMPSGGMLLEFPTLSNRTYTVEYTTNLLSTNWLAVQPALIAPANYTFWIDYGPPATLSQPTNSAVRFYRVFLNP